MPQTLTSILYQHGCLSDLDFHFANLMARLAEGQASEELRLASALVSGTTTGEKQVCLDLKHRANTPLNRLFPEIPAQEMTALEGLRTPELRTWVNRLKDASVVGAPGEYRPLILDRNHRVYLYRYWEYERQVAKTIHQRLGVPESGVDAALLRKGFEKYFKPRVKNPDWQKVAAFAALTRRFCVISGGPGTGKTHTVAAIALLLLEQDPGCEIRLAAPTGKAAARLQEEMKAAVASFSLTQTLKKKIPEDAFTLHRLLGARPHSSSFRHNPDNPLTADTIIVDEASMVPLTLMAKVFQATRPETRVILLGDKDQLASVEAGAVFGDICAASPINAFSEDFCARYRETAGQVPDIPCHTGNHPLEDCAVELQHSYRFESTPVIGEVSRCVNRGRAREALTRMRGDAEIQWVPLPERDKMPDSLSASAVSAFEAVYAGKSVQDAFRGFERFRVLCAARKGPYGVEAVNRLVETALQEKNRIQPGKRFYRGRPLMITRNDYTLKLFNGDTGIIWEDDRGELRAWFPDRGGRFRVLPPSRLPEHETAFAMTVHKSQGSEFDRVLFLLPDRDSPLLTRELLYTGITRARREIILWMEEKTFISAAGKRVTRASGLRDALLKEDPGAFCAAK